MHVGIIGTGSVGTALGRGLVDAGHEVTYGSRDPAAVPDDLVAFAASVGDQRAATAGADAVVLAVPAGAVVDLAGGLADDLAGATVVDPTNEYPEATAGESVAERVAAVAPAARVVKAFNTVGANVMADPTVAGERATMCLCGDDDAALLTVETLAADLGFAPVRTGGLARADRLESLGRLWIDLAGQYGRDLAFRLLGV